MSWWIESPALFILFSYCAPAVFVLELQTNARWAFLQWFLSLLSALNIRFALSLEQKCWNGYSLMNCWPDKSMCVCLWLVVCEKWRLWLGVEGAAEPWDVRLWEHRRFLYHTHSALLLTHNLFHFSLRCPEGLSGTSSVYSIGNFKFQLRLMLNVGLVFVLFYRIYKINVISFRAWFWINETKTVSEGTDRWVCSVNYMHYWTTPVWIFGMNCIWIY